MSLCKARLIELDQRFTDVKPGGKNVPVQFNPESLKLTYANQLVQPQGGDQAAGTAGRQFVGAGTTKLALTLWFDVGAQEPLTDPQSTGEQGIVDDVRRLTQHVVYFMTPQAAQGDAQKLAPPGVRFEWGTFSFNGMVEGMEETIEFFSPEGKPLRASIGLTLTAQKILPRDASRDGPPLPARPGHKPLQAARQGESLQRMAGAAGKDDWQGIAAANGIEDPLRMAPGTLVDLSLGLGASAGVAGAAGGAALSIGAALGAGAGAGAGAAGAGRAAPLNASLGGGAGASLRLG